MLSNMNARQPCDHCVKEYWELLLNWDMVQWLDTKHLKGFDEDNKCTLINTKLIPDVFWMPTE